MIKNRNIDKNAKISPAKLDRYEQYCVIKPSESATWFVNEEDISGGDVAEATVANERADYPRNLLLTTTENSGSDLAVSAAITGEDQFGAPITETIATTGGTGTAAGSKIFAKVTAVALTVTNGAASDVCSLGYVIAASDTAKIGLPAKIGAYTDIKAVTQIDNGTAKMEETVTGDVDTTYHAYMPNSDIVAEDDYVILFRPTKWKKGQSQDADL